MENRECGEVVAAIANPGSTMYSVQRLLMVRFELFDASSTASVGPDIKRLYPRDRCSLCLKPMCCGAGS